MMGKKRVVKVRLVCPITFSRKPFDPIAVHSMPKLALRCRNQHLGRLWQRVAVAQLPVNAERMNHHAIAFGEQLVNPLLTTKPFLLAECGHPTYI